MDQNKNRQQYWRRNLLYLGVLLAIWFAVSFGCGILFVDECYHSVCCAALRRQHYG